EAPARRTPQPDARARKRLQQFGRISWDEAIETITRRFKEIAESADGPQAILPYSYAGTMGQLHGSSLDRRFFHRLGASLLDRTICATTLVARASVLPLYHPARGPATTHSARLLTCGASNTDVNQATAWTPR